jgi:ATP-dependent protease ClpP protease subunit
MARDDRKQDIPAGLMTPQVSLMGTVDEAMAEKLCDALANAEPADEPFTVEMMTLGGDPEMARRMLLDVDLARARLKSRRMLFLGKTVVYSAGATFMAGFPREDRFLTNDATLLIHCRQLDKTLEIEGPVRANIPMIEAMLHQLKTGVDLEVENFEKLIAGSDVTMDELLEKALYNWYLTAEEAVDRGLVAQIVDPAG